MNKEQKIILEKLHEVKRDIASGVYNYCTHQTFGNEKIDIFETYYDADKKAMHKLFWYNHKTMACGYTEYDKNGPEKQTMDYYENGQLICSQYQNGHCCDEKRYLNGKLNGVCIQRINSHTIEESYYENGEKSSVTIEKIYYDNGILKERSELDNGVKFGKSCTFYPNGRIHEQMDYKNGRLNSFCTTYYPNGKVHTEVYYSDGCKDGYCLEYRENGIKHKETNYKNDVLDGSFCEYDTQGYLSKMGFYKNGLLNGAVSVYNQDGSVSSRIIYINGKEVTPPKPLALSQHLSKLSGKTIVPPTITTQPVSAQLSEKNKYIDKLKQPNEER